MDTNTYPDPIKPISVDCSTLRRLNGVSEKQIDWAMRLRTVKIENALNQANRAIAEYQNRTDIVGRACAKAYKSAFWAAFVPLASIMDAKTWIETDPLSKLHFAGEQGVREYRKAYWAEQGVQY